MSEYDLKESEKSIGQLYPILEAKDGEIIDGLHRDEADKAWKRVTLEHIDTEEKKLIARLVANFHRRIVPYQEKKEWINGLARIYQTKSKEQFDVPQRIADVSGLAVQTVRRYLNNEFKRPYPKEREDPPRIPAANRIEHVLGKDYVERHREEVIEEEKPKIEREIKKTLLRNPTFQKQVIDELRKPKIIKPTEACPSGVCELPSTIESGEPLDIRKEAVDQFFQDNPKCLCQTCPHYQKCGVIY